LGAFARKLVVGRFGLRRAAQLQESEYAAAIAEPIAGEGHAIDLARCAAGVFNAKVRRKYQRWRGTVAVDDANARALTEPLVAR
jgi:hypothetical protein